MGMGYCTAVLQHNTVRYTKQHLFRRHLPPPLDYDFSCLFGRQNTVTWENVSYQPHWNWRMPMTCNIYALP